MRQLSIVGYGMCADTVTLQGMRAIESADALLGAPRMIESLSPLKKPSYPLYDADEIAQWMRTTDAQNVCVLVSGDTGFYSAATSLCARLQDCDIEVIPGISSLGYFFAQLKMPWQDVALLSAHGRAANVVDTVRRNRQTFLLTGGNLPEIGASLCNAGFGGLQAIVGENLAQPEQRISRFRVQELCANPFAALSVVLIENPNPDARVRSGIPDSEFVRGEVPMTKAEVRAVTLAKLGIRPHDICCDIGAGTGSVTVEMALAAYAGQVYAIDRNQKAIELVKENCRNFHVGNVTSYVGQAADVLKEIGAIDVAFIGGSTGTLKKIFDLLFAKNENVRVVVNAVTLETLQEAVKIFEAHGIQPDIVQLQVARTKLAGKSHMLEALSPVYIISGGGNG